jgi:uncharacterized protein (TIGR00369 family)
MEQERHFRALERMYLTAPINEFYKPRISVGEGVVEIEIEVREAFYHAAEAVHGSVYFKMLDDAAFFASSSLETSVFVLTTSFTTYLTRPVSKGTIRSVGKVVNKNNTQFIAEAVAYDGEGREIGRGNGIFVRSKLPLTSMAEYKNA